MAKQQQQLLLNIHSLATDDEMQSLQLVYYQNINSNAPVCIAFDGRVLQDITRIDN